MNKISNLLSQAKQVIQQKNDVIDELVRQIDHQQGQMRKLMKKLSQYEHQYIKASFADLEHLGFVMNQIRDNQKFKFICLNVTSLSPTHNIFYHIDTTLVPFQDYIDVFEGSDVDIRIQNANSCLRDAIKTFEKLEETVKLQKQQIVRIKLDHVKKSMICTEKYENNSINSCETLNKMKQFSENSDETMRKTSIPKIYFNEMKQDQSDCSKRRDKEILQGNSIKNEHEEMKKIHPCRQHIILTKDSEEKVRQSKTNGSQIQQENKILERKDNMRRKIANMELNSIKNQKKMLSHNKIAQDQVKKKNKKSQIIYIRR